MGPRTVVETVKRLSGMRGGGKSSQITTIERLCHFNVHFLKDLFILTSTSKFLEVSKSENSADLEHVAAFPFSSFHPCVFSDAIHIYVIAQ